MGNKGVPRRSRRMKSVSSRAVGVGRQQGTGVPGPVQATGDRGARVCAADYGLPMAGAVKSGLGKRIGIVTDSDSCPTLCCLVLTGEQQDREGNGYGHCGQQIPTALDYIFCHQTRVIPPPTPLPILGSGWGGA